MAAGSPLHLFGIAESRLGDVVDDHIVNVKGYSILRQDRNIDGGSVLLYVRNDLKAKILMRYKTTQKGKPLKPEFIFCAVWSKQIPPLLVVVIYRLPDVLLRDPELANALRATCPEYSQKIVMGDLNSNSLSDSSDTRYLRDFFSELSLKVINHGPTHFRFNGRSSWIDLICVDDSDVILGSEIEIPTSHSLHDKIEVTLDKLVPSHTLEQFTYRNIKGITAEQLIEHLNGCDWSACHLKGENLDAVLDCISENLQGAIKELAPLKTVTPKKEAPWIDTTHRCYNRTGRADILDVFIYLCDEVERRTETARSSYLENNINDAFDNNKNIWNEFKHLDLLPGSDEALHGFPPDELNKHFAGVSVSPEERVEIAAVIINAADENDFAFKPGSLADVHAAVKHFTSQASGEDGILQSVVAKALPVIGNRLEALFNASFARGVFPASWKRTKLLALKIHLYHSLLSTSDQSHWFVFYLRCLRNWPTIRLWTFWRRIPFLTLYKQVFENRTALRQHFSNELRTYAWELTEIWSLFSSCLQ